MTTRSLVGCALLLLAALSVLQVALDGASFHTSDRQQWRPPTHHQGAARLRRLNPNGVLAESPIVPVPMLSGAVVVADCPDILPPLLLDIFVPPRV
jgi:hypothetical protein